MGISNYTLCFTIGAGAPELDGKWKIAQIPGTLDENGNIVDPETGESVDDGMIVIDPSTGEEVEDPDDPTSDIQQEDPPIHVKPEQEDAPENEVTTPETPVVPAEPEEPETPGFSIIEPPPAA